jgi:hypothetical protein
MLVLAHPLSATATTQFPAAVAVLAVTTIPMLYKSLPDSLKVSPIRTISHNEMNFRIFLYSII